MRNSEERQLCAYVCKQEFLLLVLIQQYMHSKQKQINLNPRRRTFYGLQHHHTNYKIIRKDDLKFVTKIPSLLRHPVYDKEFYLEL